MTARRIPLAALVALLSVSLPAAAARSFGATPFNDVIAAANSQTKCSGLSNNMLAAMMLSVTWPETGAGTGTPSPMTLSRLDTGQSLYSFGTYATDERAFYHPGIGVFQLDQGGLGTNLMAWQAIRVSDASAVVALEMKNGYCTAAGTGAQKRVKAWAKWAACGAGSCETIYQEIYNSTSDTLRNITTDSTVGRDGGMSARTCRYNFAPSIQWTCFYINPAVAQGAKSFWQQAPLVGGANGATPSPLAQPFYDYLRVSTDVNNNKEYRHWIHADTASPRGEIFVRRPRGLNPRSSTEWVDNDVLCDVTFNRGSC